MVHVEKATPEMFEQVLPLLRESHSGNQNLTQEHWRMLFDYPWKSCDLPCGFVLKDGDRIVGFEALISRERIIEGKSYRICNSSSWCVLPDYRSYSMLLKAPHFEMVEQGLIFTAFTPHKLLDAYNSITGGAVLETHQIILLPVPSFGLISGLWKWSVTCDPEKFLHLLNAGDRQIYEDHKMLPCKHLVVWRGEEYCYLVHSKTEGPRGFSTSFIHYVSHLTVFLQALEKIKLTLFIHDRSMFVTIEKRMLRGHKLRFSRQVPLKIPRMFWSSTLKAEQIDSLYSEMILLEI